MYVNVDFKRPPASLVQALGELGAATVYEANGQMGRMNSVIKPLAPGMKVAGPALPVRCHPGDNLTIHVAVSVARPGDVLVVDAGGYTEIGIWGEVLTVAARARKMAGLVVDGAVRDSVQIREMGFPTFARAVSIGGASKCAGGSVGESVNCGGVTVHPGDLVIGDDDGVVMVGLENADAVLRAARQRHQEEAQIMEAIRHGKTTLELLGLKAMVERLSASSK